MNKRIPVILMILLALAEGSAQKFDNVWPGGLNEYPGEPGSGNYLIEFDNGVPEVAQYDLKMNFESTVAAISDSSGQLLFYTNGCYIANAEGDTILDGDALNPGWVHDISCTKNGYISPRGAMFLPAPGQPGLYYLLHMGVDYSANRGLTYGPFYYSIVNRYGGGGQGVALLKNVELLDVIYAPVQSFRVYEPFTAIRHGNGRDWWIVVPQYKSNRYYFFLLNPSGIHAAGAQEIGPVMKCKRIGSSAFSPDGRRYARYQNCGLLVMDFDRCKGQFSNPMYFERPAHSFGGGGVAFSGDGNRIFATVRTTILSADLNTPNPVLDSLPGAEDVLGVSFHQIQNAPDGKLYFDGLQRYGFLASLEYISDNDLSFEQEGLPLPVQNVRSLPYFPNYRLYDFADSPCDTLGINTPVSVTEPEQNTLFVVSPNPAANWLHIRSAGDEPVQQDVQITLSNALGQIVLRDILPKGASVHQISLSAVPTGIYLLTLTQSNGYCQSVRVFIRQN